MSMVGRHSAHLIMGRCISELSQIADEMNKSASSGGGAAGPGGPRISPAGDGVSSPTAARLAQQVSLLKALQRRQASS